MTRRNEDGRISLNMNTEKMIALVEKFADFSAIAGVFMPDNSIQLKDGNLLFELHTIAHAVNYRETEVDVGILPYPKYDIEQEDYLNFDWSGFMAIPVTIRNPDMVGAVVEMLSYETGNEVLSAYYDVLLDGKLARDTDTHAMLDILFSTLVYDAGGNYFGHTSSLSEMWYIIPNLAVAGNKNFSSWYRQRSRGAESIIKNFYKSLDKIE